MKIDSEQIRIGLQYPWTTNASCYLACNKVLVFLVVKEFKMKGENMILRMAYDFWRCCSARSYILVADSSSSRFTIVRKKLYLPISNYTVCMIELLLNEGFGNDRERKWTFCPIT